MDERDPHGGRFSRRRPASSLLRSTYQRKHPMSVTQLLSLQKKDPLHVALTLKSERSGFHLLIGQENLENDVLILILKVLRIACASQRKENLFEMLRMVSQVSRFMNKLWMFLNELQVPVNQELTPFLEDLVTFLETLFRAHPLEFRQHVVNFFPSISSIIEISVGNNSILTERTHKLRHSVFSQEQYAVERYLRPVKSFREISIYPVEEDFEPDPSLKPNLVEGKYANVESYLDVQFRLFREDYVRPLRESIMSYRRQRNEGVVSHFRDVRLYRNVRLDEALLTVDDGIVHKVRFHYDENINWEKSKRLIYGSLVCLSLNVFKTMLVATVAASKPCELERGVVYLRFSEEHIKEAHRLKHKTFVAIETDAYFEAYRHVLSVLQEFNPDSFPMREYIVSVSKEHRQPNYLCGNKFYCFRSIISYPVPGTIEELIYEVKNVLKITLAGEGDENHGSCQCRYIEGRETFRVLDPNTWPNEKRFGLDKTQLASFKSALTQKLSLIQGPPGTGKTHVGLKIVDALLHNQHYQYTITESVLRNPILVVCYTNHALDQFLEGVLKITNKVVRVGGRSGSEALAKHNLKYLKKNSYNDFTRSFRGGVRHSLETAIESIESLKQLRQEAKTRLLTDAELEEYIPKCHWSSLQEDHPECMSLYPEGIGSFIQYWLGSLFPSQFYFEVDGYVYLWIDDTVDEIVNMMEDMAYSEFLYNNILCPESFEGSKRSPKSSLVRNNGNDKRGNESHQSDIIDLSESADLDFIRSQRMEDEDVLKDAKVIYGPCEAPTASFHNFRGTFVSNQLKCEAMNKSDCDRCWNVWALRLPDRWKLYKYWLLTFFTESEVKIGDFRKEYEKNLKLYDELRQERERLVTQGFDVIGMTTTGAAKYKHLMSGLKPKVVIVEEAAEVQEAHIVSSLSENTEHLILIGDHQQLKPNPACYELAKNYGLNVSLFERLINNGVPYCRLGVQHRMRPSISELLVPCIYSSLENHSSVYEYENIRGMECNVFFLNHNFQEKTLNTSKCNEFEAEFLVMLCKHLVLQGYRSEQITILSTYLAQFSLVRSKAANVPLITGAKLTVVDNYQGEENDIVLVSFVRSNERGSIGFLKTDNRVCVALSRARSGFYCVGNFELLRQESSLWENIVTKLEHRKAIGSTVNTKCQIHDTFFTVFEGRDFENIPGGGCTLHCNVLLKCGHTCLRKCHPLDRDHEEYRCTFPCTKINPSCVFGHVCTLPCWAECGPCLFKVPKVLDPCFHEMLLPCSLNPLGVACQKPCTETFLCGHRCPSTCGEPCQECSFSVSKIASCGHSVTVPCSMSNLEFFVTAACRNSCDKSLACGHRCTGFCGSQCIADCLVVEEKRLPCGHLNMLPCYRKLDSDDDLMRICSASCSSVLLCGHICKGTCGECMQGRLHVPCRHQCEKKLLCGHVVKNVLCYKSVPSCKERCRNSCRHRRCVLPCSCVCLPCKSPCNWNCEHHQCSKTCDEQCDRPVCNVSCPKILPCGHNCLGYCGETCPPKCRVCDKGNLIDLKICQENANVNGPHEAKLIILESCGHVFEFEDLDIWLKQRFQCVINIVQIPVCPICSTPIQKSGRLGVLVKDSVTKVQKIKQLIYGSSFKSGTNQQDLLRRLTLLHLQASQQWDVIPEIDFLQRIKSVINRKKPRHMLLCVENYLRVCEKLSLLRSKLGMQDFNVTVSKTVREASSSIVRILELSMGSMSQQSIQEVETLIKELQRLIDNHVKSRKKHGCEHNYEYSLNCPEKSVFELLPYLDFILGNWYQCTKGHVSFSQHTTATAFLCKECEL